MSVGSASRLHSVVPTLHRGPDINVMHRDRRIFHTIRINCSETTLYHKSIKGSAMPEYVEVPLLAVAHKVYVGSKRLTRLLSDLDTLPGGEFPAVVDIGDHLFVVLAQKQLHVKKVTEVEAESGQTSSNFKSFSAFRNSPHSLLAESITDSVVRWREVSHFIVSGPAVISIVPISDHVLPLEIICKNSEHAHELHRVLIKCSRLMKNPHLNTGVMPSSFSLHSNFGHSKSRKDSFRKLVAPTFAVASNSLLFTPTLHSVGTQAVANKLHPNAIRIKDTLLRAAKLEVRTDKLPRRLLVPGSHLQSNASMDEENSVWREDGNEAAQVRALVFESSARNYPFGDGNKKHVNKALHFLSGTGNASQEPLTANEMRMFDNVECELCLLRLFTLDVVSNSDGRLIATKATMDAWQKLDEIMWQLIKEWNSIYFGENFSRCACLAIINESTKNLQFKNVYQKYGRGVHMMPGTGYVAEQKAIVPGGCIVIFTWGDVPSVLVDGHTKACVVTSGFSARFSSKKGFKLGFRRNGLKSEETESHLKKLIVDNANDSSDDEGSEDENDEPVRVIVKESSIDNDWAKFVIIALDLD